MVAALRSNCVRNVRMNFPKLFCPLKCEQQIQTEDTQEAIAKVISRVIRKRNRVIEDMDKSITRLPGAILDQSAPHTGAAAL